MEMKPAELSVAFGKIVFQENKKKTKQKYNSLQVWGIAGGNKQLEMK